MKPSFGFHTKQQCSENPPKQGQVHQKFVNGNQNQLMRLKDSHYEILTFITDVGEPAGFFELLISCKL